MNHGQARDVADQACKTERDPVCSMMVDPACTPHKCIHQGKTIYFCAAKCREKFEADPQKYLEGRIPFTEPLVAVAGAGLWMIRSALVLETRNERGELDGRIHLLAAVPNAWYEQGKEIELRGFPTYYGTVDLRVAPDLHRTAPPS